MLGFFRYRRISLRTVVAVIKSECCYHRSCTALDFRLLACAGQACRPQYFASVALGRPLRLLSLQGKNLKTSRDQRRRTAALVTLAVQVTKRTRVVADASIEHVNREQTKECMPQIEYIRRIYYVAAPALVFGQGNVF